MTSVKKHAFSCALSLYVSAVAEMEDARVRRVRAALVGDMDDNLMVVVWSVMVEFLMI